MPATAMHPSADLLANRHANNLNFIRLCFALFVLYSHSFAVVVGVPKPDPNRLFHMITMGEIGVDGFFIISGFLIFQSWESRRSPGAFLRSRILRIYPAFLVASLICILIVGPLGAAVVADYFADYKYWGGLRRLLLLRVPSTPEVFAGTHYPAVNGSMWTIGYEFGCYLAVLALGLIGALRFRFLLPLIALVMSLAYMAFKSSTTTWPWQDEPGLAPATIRFAMFFFVGGAFYYYRSKVIFRPGLALLVAVLMVAAFLSPITNEVGLALFGGYLTLYAATMKIGLLRPFATRFPDISYGTYLYGWPIQKLLTWYFPMLHPLEVLVVAALLSAVAGIISWYAIEAPSLRLKGNMPRAA